ncbi:tetratricopeptide repeat-containing diguanylate cyclase [Permianibacter aggregans]|nr:GGDEF domain-containing protein [Permianibacter aggregans]QGX41017.1 GGDEF domain-containing protein [Permianibacter aggregans]
MFADIQYCLTKGRCWAADSWTALEAELNATEGNPLPLLAAHQDKTRAWPAIDHSRFLLRMALAQEENGELDNAITSYDLAVEVLRALPPTTELATAYNERSYIRYLQTNDPLVYCPDRQLAVSIARQLPGEPETQAKTYTQYAFCFTHKREQFNEGLSLLREALEIAKSNQLSPNRIGMIYNATGLLYRKNQIYDKAHEYLTLAYEQWASVDDRQDMFNMLHTLVSVAIELNQLDQAQTYVEKMFALANNSPQFKDFTFFAELNAGLVKLAQDNYSNAISHFHRAESLANTTSEQFFITMNRVKLAKAALLGGNEKEAIQFAKTVNESSSLGSLDGGSQDFVKAMVALDNRQPVIAAKHLLDMSRSETKARRDFIRSAALEYASRHDASVAQFEKTMLETQLQIQQLQLASQEQAQKNTRIYLILSSLLAISLSMLAVVLVRSRAKFRYRAQTDHLTGAANRRHLFELAPIILNRTAAKSQPVSVLLFDIDHFKRINDKYGHDVGDEAIRFVVRTARSISRSHDLIARLGGEEFASLLPETDIIQANEIAERLRMSLQEQSLLYKGHVIKMTISIGVATRRTNDETLDSLLNHADQALYEAKRGGRNRVAHFQA